MCAGVCWYVRVCAGICGGKCRFAWARVGLCRFLQVCACVGRCVCMRECVGVHWCALVCTGVREFSEFLPENRVLTSADFNTYPIRIFFITNDVALNIYYIDIHHQLKEIFNDLNISLMIFQSVELWKAIKYIIWQTYEKNEEKSYYPISYV